MAPAGHRNAAGLIFKKMKLTFEMHELKASCGLLLLMGLNVSEFPLCPAP